MEDWSFGDGSPLAAHSLSGSAQNERCYRHRWLSEPERNLMLAVLEDAVRCFLGYTDGDRDARNRLAFVEARDWINSTSRYSIFAFRNLCEIIGIDPDSLKAELHRIRRGASSANIQFLRTLDVRSPSLSSVRTAASTRRAGSRRPKARSNRITRRSAAPVA